MSALPYYSLLLLTGTIVATAVWSRRVRSEPTMIVVLAAALIGAVVGAKAGYLLAELPWIVGRDDFWRQVLVGRTILGGLLGGYAGVEAGKRLIGIRAPTGDTFAVAVPIGLAIGRVGCWLTGCCLGQVCDDAGNRYPVVPTEIAFHLLAAAGLGLMARRGLLRGNLFHLYLLAYGAFRFVHEWWRDTPRFNLGGVPVSPYQALALAVVGFAAVRFAQRQRAAAAACRA